MLVHGHERKNPRDGFFAALFIHFLHENIDTHLHTGITDGLDAAYQLDDRPGRNGAGKINTVGRYGNTPQPRKPRGGDKCNFVHHRQCRTAEKCIVMIGIVRKNSFKNVGFRSGNSFF